MRGVGESQGSVRMCQRKSGWTKRHMSTGPSQATDLANGYADVNFELVEDSILSPV